MHRNSETPYLNALQVSDKQIAGLSDEELTDLMRALLRAQTYRAESSAEQTYVNAEGKAMDEGCDGFSATPGRACAWLGDSETCWQFKAGKAGEPRRLRGEVLKPIPAQTLIAGGRFVVVASGSTRGKSGQIARLKILKEEAVAAGLPTNKIDVFCSEQLATWCNQHPAIALQLAGRPDGLLALSQWMQDEQHQVAWFGSAARDQDICRLRSELSFVDGKVLHVHIFGPPGVGKTRLAMEVCRDADWADYVVYVRQSTETNLPHLIGRVAVEPGVRLTLVADEVQQAQLLGMRAAIGQAGGRIRLITVGHSGTPDPSSIPALRVEPLETGVVGNIVTGWYPAMPIEHVEFVVRFADGYLRLARLAADAVMRDPSLSVERLLTRSEIKVFLDRMLGRESRRALYVIAALTVVGWYEDKQVEGEAIAAHLGQNWNDVREQVEVFQREYQIVATGGRYRYISPNPLANYLAMEAWTTFPDLMTSLPAALPNEQARDAYFERLKLILSNPHAREYAREQLQFFFQLDKFLDSYDVRRWSALSAAEPEHAAKRIAEILRGASVDERQRINELARREMVRALVHLARNAKAFVSAIQALAFLAEAENEAWANNATGEFVNRFHILGGTELPYMERLNVLDELVQGPNASLGQLAIKALACAGEDYSVRFVEWQVSGEMPAIEWEPGTHAERWMCVRASLSRLASAAELGRECYAEALLSAARQMMTLLTEASVRPQMQTFLLSLRNAYPDTREVLRSSIADVEHRATTFWKDMLPSELAAIKALHNEFSDVSLLGRLQQLVQHANLEREHPTNLIPIAKELLASRESVADAWLWLTSGSADNGWALGEALAEGDVDGRFCEWVRELPSGRDHRVLCGYISALRARRGDAWFNDWMRELFARTPPCISLVIQVAWRCGVTDELAGDLAALLRAEHPPPEAVGQLAFGTWSKELSVPSLGDVLHAMRDFGSSSTVVQLLSRRLKANPSELEDWSGLALELICDADIICGDGTTTFHWKELATRFAERAPEQISAAILEAHANHQGVLLSTSRHALQVVSLIASVHPIAVWRLLSDHLASARGPLFAIGIPGTILQLIPADVVLDWVNEHPDKHGAVIGRLVARDVNDDDKLGARILGMYGDSRSVANAFDAAYVSGGWTGSDSAHWRQLAESAETAAKRTNLPKLRVWASNIARQLNLRAEQCRRDEDEYRAKMR